ncbi:CBS domain-containing protein [Ginsengibacter hankyongi]|uniref:CBS domain-containing protein n=1 Tax=Ginsengibacter hankyongi TaxID=2607284 RepID=A0A5J5IPE8_9BACT|nr:CBS domain-containing protein [Ginsengibacter hankyongi]KAA9041877.1 CBS domain-containing protein [Ginsengibacter hankyongi]
MLAQELINTILPQLQLTDTVSKALQLMSDFKMTHLPVVSEEKYLGMISEDDLLDEENKKIPIEFFQNDFIPASVNSNKHFLDAVTISNQYHTNVIPVVTETNEFVGTIAGQQLLAALGNFSGANEPGAVIVLEMERSNFSISEISRIVESDGAVILHLNITIKPDTSLIQITIHLNKKEISVIIAAFERYEYTISYYSGEQLFENEIDNNYRHLMNYLDI